MDMLRKQLNTAGSAAKIFIKWLLVAVVIGCLGGLVGAAFHLSVDYATEFREEFAWLLYLLPVAGVLIAVIYKVTGMEGKGTNAVIDAVNLDKPVHILLLPAIFLSTVLTHLCGGSAGREGAALQIGGSIGSNIGRAFKLDMKDNRVTVMCGMSAVFAALFGTPVAATIFAIEVSSVGAAYYGAFVPCIAAALSACAVTSLFGIHATAFTIASVPAFTPVMLLKAAALAVIFAVMSIVFCKVIHNAEHIAERYMKNSIVRGLVGGALVIALTLLVGTRDYNGAGMGVITAAVEQGKAVPEAFFFKLLFTAVSLACGFKGGEVVPTFFVGATLGCVLGPIFGVPAGFAAALGLISVFCGATNCMLASVALSIELFGAGGLVYFALVCGISYMLSGAGGLYSSQKIVFSKFRAEERRETVSAH